MCCAHKAEGRQEHRGKLLSVVPSKNLENSSVWGKFEKLFFLWRIYTCTLFYKDSSYIPAGVSCHFILTYTGIPEPFDERMSKGSHFCVGTNSMQYL